MNACLSFYKSHLLLMWLNSTIPTASVHSAVERKVRVPPSIPFCDILLTCYPNHLQNGLVHFVVAAAEQVSYYRHPRSPYGLCCPMLSLNEIVVDEALSGLVVGVCPNFLCALQLAVVVNVLPVYAEEGLPSIKLVWRTENREQRSRLQYF